MTAHRNQLPGTKDDRLNPGQCLAIVMLQLSLAESFCRWWISPVRTYRGPELPLG